MELRKSTIAIIVLSWIFFFITCFLAFFKLDQMHTEKITNEKIFREESSKDSAETIAPKEDTSGKKEDEVTNVKAFIAKYYTYIQKNDLKALKPMVEDYTELCQKQESLKQYVEGYRNLSYTIEYGADQTSYLVYASYQLKIKGIKTLAPGMTPYYIVKKDKSFLIYNNEKHYTDEMKNAKKQSLTRQEIRDLTDKINAEYEKALKKDKKLEGFLKGSE